MRNRWRSYKEAGLTAFMPAGRNAAGSSLYANSVFLIMNSAAGAVLGFVFWVLAARLYPAEAVGSASAVVSVAALLTFIATLGFGTGLIRFLSEAGSNKAALINSCFTLSGLVALAAALVFLAGISLWSPAMQFVRDDSRFALTFVIFVVSGTLVNLLNDTYLAFGRAEYTFAQGLTFGLLKVALVAAFVIVFSVFGIVASVALATAILAVAGMAFFLPRLQPCYRPEAAISRHFTGEIFRFSLANYAGQGLASLPGWLLPVIVLGRSGSQENAHFFIAWSIAVVLFSVPNAISNSLFAECSRDSSRLARDLRRSLVMSAVLGTLAAIIFAAGGNWILLAFGRQYSSGGLQLLWLLVPSVLPLSVTSLYLAVAKIRKKVGYIIAANGAIAAGTLLPGYLLLPRLGILAPGLSWLVSQTVVALVVLLPLIRILKTGETGGVAS